MDSKEEEEEQMEVYKSEDEGEKDSDYDQAAENDCEQGAQALRKFRKCSSK